MAPTPAAATASSAETTGLSTATLDKYKDASKLVDKAIRHVLTLCKEGANVLSICREGDKKVEEEADKVYNKKGSTKIAKGLSFPTTLSVNGVLANFSPLPSDAQNAGLELKKDDLVKINIGAHIDGYASFAGESIVVGQDEVKSEDIRADLISAAYNASEIALRFVKPGVKNWEVTNGISKVLEEYKEKKVKGVEYVANSASFGWRMDKDDIQAKKTITPFPTSEQRRDSDNTHTLEEGEVYSLTVAVTNAAESKAKDSSAVQTSLYCRLPTTYQLKMKASREVYSEIVKKAGAFPFPLRIMENETRAKLAVRECVQHGLLKPFEVLEVGSGSDLTAAFTITFVVTKSGAARISLPPAWYSADKVKSSVELSAETKALVTKSLKSSKKKTEKKDGATA